MVTVIVPELPTVLKLKKSYSLSRHTYQQEGDGHSEITYMLGPLPAVKFFSSPPRGQGVTADSVLPYAGSSTQEIPETVVFRDA